MSPKPLPFESDHFTLYQLADGVFAAIAISGGAAVSNAGIIDLGDKTLIFDTLMTPQAAEDLRLAAQQVTGRDPEIIINSHYHNDHIWGNQVFSPQAQIISATQTRRFIETSEELEWARDVSARRLEEAKKQLAEAKTEHERGEARLWMGYFQGLVDDLPRLNVRLPDITFDERLTIYGESLTLDLIPFENAHTDNDVILYLREPRIVFAADLLFVGCHPYLAECEGPRLLDALQQMQQMDAVTFVPGHGQIGDKKDLAVMADYVTTCMDRAKSLATQGNVTEERISQEKIPERFAAWELSRFYYTNLEEWGTQFQSKGTS